MSKHTPGPWKYRNALVDSEKNIIASINDQLDEYKFNVRLISAAPEMLKALKELVVLMDAVREGDYTPDSFTTQLAISAIAKAEGRE